MPALSSEVVRFSSYYLATLLLERIGHEDARDDELISLATKIVRRLKPFGHSRDFCSVKWFGHNYVFTPTQAAIVQALWRAWKRGTPAVRQETLLVAAGSWASEDDSEDSRVTVRALFRGSPAWGVMIQPAAKGSYQIVEPK